MRLLDGIDYMFFTFHRRKLEAGHHANYASEMATHQLQVFLIVVLMELFMAASIVSPIDLLSWSEIFGGSAKYILSLPVLVAVWVFAYKRYENEAAQARVKAIVDRWAQEQPAIRKRRTVTVYFAFYFAAVGILLIPAILYQII